MTEPEATRRIEPVAAGPSGETSPQPIVRETAPGALAPYLQAAALSFLGALAIGALFLIALKLQFRDLGADADPIDILTSLVVLTLAALRVPIHIGDVTITVLPLGALAALAMVVRWACRATIPLGVPRRAPLVGGFFAVFACLAALIFRFRFEPDPIYAGAFGALILGGLWVALFAWLSVLTSRTGLRDLIRGWAEGWSQRRPQTFEGVRAGLLMLGLLVLFACAAALLWAIVYLLRGEGPRNLQFGGLVAALFYIVVFAPNLVVVVMSLSLGAPVDVGAGLTVGGRVRERVEQISVFDDGGLSILLLLLPLAACAFGGYWARRNTRDSGSYVPILLVAALVFGGVLALLAALGDVRLGARLATDRGFGLVAPRAWLVFVLGVLWSAGCGYAGWAAAERER